MHQVRRGGGHNCDLTHALRWQRRARSAHIPRPAGTAAFQQKRLIKSVASRLLTSWPIAPQARYMLPRPARLLASHNRNNTLAGMAPLRGRMRAHRGREKSQNFHANKINRIALLILFVSFCAPPSRCCYVLLDVNLGIYAAVVRSNHKRATKQPNLHSRTAAW